MIQKFNSTEKEEPEQMTSEDFPASFSQFKEGSKKINESKAPKCMDKKIKMKEVDISNDDRPKLEKIVEYWNEE